MRALHPLNLERLRYDVHNALRAWHDPGVTESNLLEDLLIVQEQRLATGSPLSSTSRRLVTNQILLTCLETLAAKEPLSAQLLRARFLDQKTVGYLANELNLSQDTINRRQSLAMRRLVGIVLDRERAARERQAVGRESQLPPPTYVSLIGLDDTRAKLRKLVLLEEAPWVVALVGIGGIGKTALADRLAREVIRQFHFERVIWLRANAQSLSGGPLPVELTFEHILTELAEQLWPQTAETLGPQARLEQIRQTLKAGLYLIVVDNLETTEADTAQLVGRLQDWAGPSKFLLTSRTRPAGQAPAFILPLNELPLSDASRLLQHQAEMLGVTALTEATDSEIKAIYATVGGNPLALKLVVGLIPDYPLSQILADLSQSRPGPIENLYRHIYLRLWHGLSVEGRALLQAMLLVGEAGAAFEHLQAISQLTEAQLGTAIRDLATRSLLEVRGGISAKRYGIHRLTETFLRTEIVGWPEEETV